jgi:hypothetical protein
MRGGGVRSSGATSIGSGGSRGSFDRSSTGARSASSGFNRPSDGSRASASGVNRGAQPPAGGARAQGGNRVQGGDRVQGADLSRGDTVRGGNRVNTGDATFNRNVAVNGDVDGWGGWDDHPVGAGLAIGTAAAVTAAAIGSTYYALPSGCPPYSASGYTYYSCGGAYYEPRYEGTSVVYVTVPAPGGGSAE